ncbi:MAG TPA: HAMP domain-containing sensor histidine kinase [Ohtaekwangia sp.]|nr:HAMP domain-containing sensor histidine kinase [Ohtaekwangia sp.]
MKLINQFTVWYLIITLFVLLAGGVIIYENMAKEIDKEESRELQFWIDNIAGRLERGVPLRKINHDPVEIKQLQFDAPEIPFHVKDTFAMHQQLQRVERHLKGSASYKINGNHYLISTYDIMVEPDDIVDAVQKSMIWIVVILLVFVLISSRVISNYILRPFHATLAAIESFRLNQKNKFMPDRSTTNEFNNLNDFLITMTNKAKQDYQSLKEFTENASHEMQTPLAIIRGKLELLMESEIKDEQAKLILSAHEAVEKLSRMGQALTLLTKLNNQEYAAGQSINLSELVTKKLSDFEDLFELKTIAVTRIIQPDVYVSLHPTLADILLNNLFNNSIRHNFLNGSIEIDLRTTRLTLKNTGEPPSLPPEELFNRFKKGNQDTESVGLGLAIVKQICILNQLAIDYQFEEGWHKIQVSWK